MDVTKEQREELRRQWVAALRSGEFTQTRGYLCHKGRYCCLGIACEVFDRAFPGELEREVLTDRITFNNHATLLPDVVRHAVGITYAGGDFVVSSLDDEDESSLAERNDDGATFAEIADLIEARPPGLFIEGES